jgi:hypothetical protein
LGDLRGIVAVLILPLLVIHLYLSLRSWSSFRCLELPPPCSLSSALTTIGESSTLRLLGSLIRMDSYVLSISELVGLSSGSLFE